MSIAGMVGRFAIVWFALVLGACGGGGGGSADEGGSTPPPSAQTGIGAAGGTITAGGATLDIPAGALEQNTTITVATSNSSAGLPEAATVRGPLFDFGPDGTTFAVPAELTLPMPATPAAGERAVISWLDTEHDEWIDTSSAVTGDRIAAPITHFTVYAIRFIPPPSLDAIVRWWSFYQTRVGAFAEERLGPDAESQFSPLRMRIGGVVRESHDFGPLRVFPAGKGPNATTEVFSNETGHTYWVSAESPRANGTHPDVVGSSAELVQSQWFRKVEAGATLKLHVTAASLEGLDTNGAPTQKDCPWLTPETHLLDCRRTLSATASYDVRAFWFEGQKDILHTGGFAELNGWRGVWDMGDVYPNSDATSAFWGPASFAIERDVDGDGGIHATMRLRAPITIDVPLSKLAVGDRFEVFVIAKVHASNRRNAIDGVDSYVSAFFRDPVVDDGLSFDFAGLEPVAPAGVAPHDGVATAAPPCASGVDPAGGVLAFSAAAYAEPEIPGQGAIIVVSRSGGSRGAASVRLTSGDGTAVGGKDYTAIDTQVLFADGEEGSRAVRVAILADDLAAADRTVNLTLSAPGGCATLAEPSAAVLTILDDDRPPLTPEDYTIGGTVTGLVGTGLVLQDLNLAPITPGNGPFTFALPTRTGSPYAVTILTQPNNPIQVCTITNGSGTVADGNVTNVAVNCVTPPTSGALDPVFGGTGKVATAFGGVGTDMALQSDGTIVMVGDSGSDFVLALYGADGTLARTVTTDISGGNDEAHGVAIQPDDDKIVVVGSARVGTNDDFAIVRYNADGTLDESFGTLGKVTTNFNGGVDEAYGVVIQPDHRIVVVGNAALSPGGTDFAIARYEPNGILDIGFGTNGKLTIDIAGALDFGRNVVLQGDAILVSGPTTLPTSVVIGHVGLARFSADGTLDTSFAAGGPDAGKLSLPNLALGEGLALQADGKVLLAGTVAASAPAQFGLMRLDANGGTDRSFGTDGLVTTPFSTLSDFGYAVAVQSDDKIVVAGESSNSLNPDFAVARYDIHGVLDPTFGTAGKLTIDFFGSRDGGRTVVVQPDGKIVLGGFALNGTSVGFGLVRINP